MLALIDLLWPIILTVTFDRLPIGVLRWADCSQRSRSRANANQ